MRWQSRLGGNVPTSWGSSAHPYTEFSGAPTGVTGQLGSSSEFREDWYKPMFSAFNRAPMAGMIGGGGYTGAGSNLITEGQSKFVEAGDVLNQAGLSADNLLSGFDSPIAQESGYEGPVILKEGQHEIISAGQDLAAADTEYEREKARIDEAEIAAEDTKKDAFKSARIARQEALSGRAPEYERAKAGIASTGMSYSAPAERNLEAVQEEGFSDLSSISRDKYEAVDAFKKNRELLEGERTIADEDMETARGAFSNDMQAMLQDSATKGAELIHQARTLPDEWKLYGQEMAGKRSLRKKHGEVPYGTKRGGGGIGGGIDYFAESGDVIPELGQLTQLVREADMFAEQLGAQDVGSWLPNPESEGV
jgi:hypothetical protein